jgi:uncharacterized membrane protein
MNKSRILTRLREGLWFIPLMCVLVGIALSLGTIEIDRAYGFKLVPTGLSGEPDAALAILGTIAASMVSLAALVLTITMVVVQLAMGQFSPRIVQRFQQDKPSQLAIGIFVGTFAHAMLTLREVKTENGGAVPGLAVVVAFVLVLICIIVLVWYVNHIGRSLRVSALIELVGKDTRELIDRLYPKGTQRGADSSLVSAPRPGVITQLDHSALVKEAQRADCVLRLKPSLGEFVPTGGTLFEVDGETSQLDQKVVIKAVALDLERTLDEDMAYGLRLLVDIAERSLSDGPFQDPTTAVQAIDRLHDCLRQLAARVFPDGKHRDNQGTVRLVVPEMDWDALVHLAFDEIRMVGAGSPQIARRLRAALEDLKSIAPSERQTVLREQLELLSCGVDEKISNERDRERASLGDAQGLG